jgi:hypothetical protein
VVHNVPGDIINIVVTGLGAGVITFFIGLGVILNALFFTIPAKQLRAPTYREKAPESLDAPRATPLPLREASTASSLPAISVTEHTTQHLEQK